MVENVNKIKQEDEIQALSSIYGTDFTFENEKKTEFSIQVTEVSKCAILQVTFLDTYPNSLSPTYSLSAPWLDRTRKQELCRELERICLENLGESVVYLLVECIRQFLMKKTEVHELSENIKYISEPKVDETCPDLSETKKDEICPDISSGEIITDRKSTFQAHLAKITSEKQLQKVLKKLYENRKIGNANHNIYAYRYYTPSGLLVQNYDDDGESHAGNRILHLLQVLDAENVVVIVTRWYGGIHLGSDRFKHIGQASRNILNACGYLKSKIDSVKKKK